MTPNFIGETFGARDAGGRRRVRIATVFPRAKVIVTLPGIHATQRVAYTDSVNQQRKAAGLEPLQEEAEEALWLTAVDLIVDDDSVLIRPDPSQMDLAFEADELLQQVVSKKQIKFLHVLHPAVRGAIKRRGECWRINPLPRSPKEMLRMIESARIGIGGREIYYYNAVTGTRVLTCQQFVSLASLDEGELRQHLVEIGEFCARTNRMGNPEIALFQASANMLSEAFAPHDFASLDAGQFQRVYQSLRDRFHAAVAPEFRRDDPNNPMWRSGMYATLIGQTDKAVTEESLLGLSAEFFMQVEWVPGGRVEDGEFIVDEVFDEEDADTSFGEGKFAISDTRARGLIFNILRDYGDVEHLNIGRVAQSLSRRKAYGGRRGIYLAELQQHGRGQPILRIIRMQKRGVWEGLDHGEDLLNAILKSEEYTEQILDRRLACRQLGMNLPLHVTARKLCERYSGSNWDYSGTRIWSTYFERDYVAGLATDKIASSRFVDEEYALKFARVLGRAAAPDLIVGRSGPDQNLVFDSGDEVIVEDACGMPADVVVIDHTGTFLDWERDLIDLAPGYAACIQRRAGSLGNPSRFAEVFIDALVGRFAQIRHDCLKRTRAFDQLFRYERLDDLKRFSGRWRTVLKRLRAAEPSRIGHSLREAVAIA